MDAYAFALALGTAGLSAMTVLGFHHGRVPGRTGHGHHHSTHIRGADRAAPTGATRSRGSAGSTDEASRPPGTGGGRLNVSIERFSGLLERRYSREPGGAA